MITPLPLPGFLARFSEPLTAHLLRFLDKTGDLFRIDVSGIDRLPAGRALLVTNHAFGFDAALLMTRIGALTHRRVWALGEHAWWKVPVLGHLAAAAGTVDGTPSNVDQLLRDDELVLVLPGGLREAMKPRELRYRLLWGHRYGFVRAAMRNNAPIVPIASLGAEEIFDLVGNPFARGRRLHLPFPLPKPAHWLPIPHRHALRYVVGEAIPTGDRNNNTSNNDDNDAGDTITARRLRREVEGALHEMFEDDLAKCAGVGFSA